MAKVDANSLLLEDEQRLILKTRKLREDMVDNFIAENKGLPTKTGEIRVLNEVLNSIDSNVTSVVDLRLKDKDNANNEDLTETIKEIFLKRETFKETDVVTDAVVPEMFVPDDIVPGEDQIEYQEISLSEIIDK